MNDQTLLYPELKFYYLHTDPYNSKITLKCTSPINYNYSNIKIYFPFDSKDNKSIWRIFPSTLGPYYTKNSSKLAINRILKNTKIRYILKKYCIIEQEIK